MASIAELAHGEKLRTQSLNHSSSLFDAPGTEALALRKTTATLNSFRQCNAKQFTNTITANVHKLLNYWND